MNEIEQLKARIKKLEEQLQVVTDKVIFNKDIMMQDGRDFIFAKGTGTKIGTETTQKISFYGETPVVQAAAITAPSDAGGSYNQSVAQSAVTAINSIRTALQNIGITA